MDEKSVWMITWNKQNIFWKLKCSTAKWYGSIANVFKERRISLSAKQKGIVLWRSCIDVYMKRFHCLMHITQLFNLNYYTFRCLFWLYSMPTTVPKTFRYKYCWNTLLLLNGEKYFLTWNWIQLSTERSLSRCCTSMSHPNSRMGKGDISVVSRTYTLAYFTCKHTGI